ncbi:DegT/DnrJ/EryC1/StrS family aminotransferase [Nocardiopsis tropica]|uniref:DegT/DnrJ/EryC1/StrS family aminotransferase n=1 Tax=Nocardiopsis tropica TaxID=109330 RepID=A0ABV1ZRH7_9ACTN
MTSYETREPTAVASHELSLDEADVDAVVERMRSALTGGDLTAGPQVSEFEGALREYTGRRAAVAVANGTAALELVLRALGVGPGHEVLVQSGSFIASAAAVASVGAHVRFVDMAPDQLGPTAAQVEAALGPATTAVLVTHLGGLISGHLDDVARLCRERGLRLIEDAAQALGSLHDGRAPGSWGVAATFSFYARKVLTTGEGGAVVTDDPDLARLVRLLGDQGRSPDGVHRIFGTNARMTEFQAALGLVQFDRLDERLAARRAIAARYDAAFGPHRRPVPPQVRPNHYKYWLELPTERHRDDFAAALAEQLVELPGPLTGHALPIHRQPASADRSTPEELPETDRFASTHVCLPVYPGLTEDRVERVIAAGRRALNGVGSGNEEE